MATLTVPIGAAEYSRLEGRAVDDARKTQAAIVEECSAAGEPPPPYELMELIGKGSFGRVYKAAGHKTRQLVAVKIISIEEGDSFQPGRADTFSDILKEVGTLKRLNESGAKNINSIIETLLVGQSIWMVTKYCAGGSVATLMRPTGGLAERWIIPILREVAEAIHWIHKQGIIHRDIKCANVLVNETGDVELCDFGVAGIIETKFDKRSTVTGTLQWMAPELFESSTSYGTEVDIWAFGSMAYEAATGLPPNATTAIDITKFGPYLKHNCPRLEGDQYSQQLVDIVSYCLVQDPARRPIIEQVQKHIYILNTNKKYPTSSLAQLVHAYKLWQLQGGTRQSLFSAGGAQGPLIESSNLPSSDEWDFGTMSQADIELYGANAQTVYDAYGPGVGMPQNQPRQVSARRERNMKPLVVPLEQVFDAGFEKDYEENVRAFYNTNPPPPTTDLPLREETETSTARESLIDLDASLDGNDLSLFVDMETIKAGPRSMPDDMPDRRHTQEWKFPMMGPASVATRSEDERSLFVNAFSVSDDRHIGSVGPSIQVNRASAMTLIDLDASLDLPGRPTTAGSDIISTVSDVGSTPFALEDHLTETDWATSSAEREPSVYVPDGIGFVLQPPEHVAQISATARVPRPAPSLPLPPSTAVMLDIASAIERKDELYRMITSLKVHLEFVNDTLSHLPIRQDT